MALDTQTETARVASLCAHLWTIESYSYEERREDRWVNWKCSGCGTERRIITPALAGEPPH